MAKISKISIEQNEDVYDITVPGTHCFFADGILVHNCVEIGMFPQYEGVSGWQGCNLTEINGGKTTTRDILLRAARAAAALGTLQAGYTDFAFLSTETKKIFDREALLGVSITGWMNNPRVLFDEDNMALAAAEVLAVNERVAEMIGINPAARTTCVKPSGSASIILKTTSGIHGEHSPRYLRLAQMNKDTFVAKLMVETNPEMVEESYWSASKSDYTVAFPVHAPEGSVYNDDLHGVELLKRVKLVQNVWIEKGTRLDRCVNKNVRHNVSNTVTVTDWDEVEEYVYKNRESFAGISFLGASGDRDYYQAPFTRVFSGEEIIARHGPGAIFASGLVVHALEAFDNLWAATSTARGFGEDISTESHINSIKRDWCRRFKKFADNYFDGDPTSTDLCLKDVFLLHRWERITRSIKPVDWTKLTTQSMVHADTLGAAACVGTADGCLI